MGGKKALYFEGKKRSKKSAIVRTFAAFPRWLFALAISLMKIKNTIEALRAIKINKTWYTMAALLA